MRSPSPDKLAGIVSGLAKPGDYVVCLGAGSITQWAYALPGELAALGGLAMTQKTALALRHVAFENVGVWAEAFDEAGYSLKYIEVGPRPLPLEEIKRSDVLIILGGPIGVYETEAYPFLVEEIAAIAARLAARRPTLGVCLGAQLMAAALGARVAPGPGKEIGYAPVELTTAALKTPLAAIAGLSVLHWHGDAFDLPQGAERLASTKLCPNQAFRIGDWALGLQFHVEADPARAGMLADRPHGRTRQGRDRPANACAPTPSASGRRSPPRAGAS